MVHWCVIAHDHAEIDGATWDATTTKRTESTTGIPEQRTKSNQQHTCLNNKQNRIKNIHAWTTNKTELTTYMPEQRTKLNRPQTCRNNEQNRINNRHVATMKKPDQ
jgi:hypothetical protein